MRKLFSTAMLSVALLAGYSTQVQANVKVNIPKSLQGCFERSGVDSPLQYTLTKNTLKFGGIGVEGKTKFLSIKHNNDSEFSALVEWSIYDDIPEVLEDKNGKESWKMHKTFREKQKELFHIRKTGNKFVFVDEDGSERAISKIKCD